MHCGSPCYGSGSATMGWVVQLVSLNTVIKNQESLQSETEMELMEYHSAFELEEEDQIKETSLLPLDSTLECHSPPPDYNSVVHYSTGSDPSASFYWLAHMLERGEDPLYVAKRLMRFASEDIGLADPSTLAQALATYKDCHFRGMPECEVLLAQCVVYFARTSKSIEVYSTYNNIKACPRTHQGPLPPSHCT
ncbi:ATPase WRNIP1 [Myotis brandtii]|uniref:ATPase WRNIP1 n=1 Tax=Myotis brandtii TaxID=109478 RepID=S7MT57_MYOBR|nr:ATPase WRNIP1 [Myotis brandtii]